MRQFILRTELNCKALYAYLKQNWQSMANDNKPLAVTVATHKDKRHNQQNRLYWQYLNQIAEQAMIEGKRYCAKAWHEHFKRELGVIMNNKPLPCPFCGSTPMFHRSFYEGKEYSSYYCPKNLCPANNSTSHQQAQQESLKIWNKRK